MIEGFRGSHRVNVRETDDETVTVVGMLLDSCDVYVTDRSSWLTAWLPKAWCVV